jgi:hypothetical protein
MIRNHQNRARIKTFQGPAGQEPAGVGDIERHENPRRGAHRAVSQTGAVEHAMLGMGKLNLLVWAFFLIRAPCDVTCMTEMLSVYRTGHEEISCSKEPKYGLSVRSYTPLSNAQQLRRVRPGKGRGKRCCVQIWRGGLSSASGRGRKRGRGNRGSIVVVWLWY